MRPALPVREMFFSWTTTMRPMRTQVTPATGAVTTAWDTECYAGHAAQHEKLYCPDRPVPPKLEMNISPEGLIQSPAEYSRSLLATTHRCRSWFFGLKPSGTVPICLPLHDPEILVVTLYRFIATRPPMRANCISPPAVATETKLRDTECYAAIQTEWPMFRPPATAAALIKVTTPVSETSTSAVLLEVMPPGLVNTAGSRKLLAGRNPAGSVPTLHNSVVS